MRATVEERTQVSKHLANGHACHWRRDEVIQAGLLPELTHVFPHGGGGNGSQFGFEDVQIVGSCKQVEGGAGEWVGNGVQSEVVGVEALSRLAHDCFGEEDPCQIFYTGKLQEIVEHEDGSCTLYIPLPFVTGDDVKLRTRGDELFVTIGNFKREMILPTVLAKRKAGGGALDEGVLEINFLPVEEPVAE